MSGGGTTIMFTISATFPDGHVTETQCATLDEALCHVREFILNQMDDRQSLGPPKAPFRRAPQNCPAFVPVL